MRGAFRGGFSAFCVGAATVVEALVDDEPVVEAESGPLNGTPTKFVSAIAEVTAATPNDAWYVRKGEGRHTLVTILKQRKETI